MTCKVNINQIEFLDYFISTADVDGCALMA